MAIQKEVNWGSMRVIRRGKGVPGALCLKIGYGCEGRGTPTGSYRDAGSMGREHMGRWGEVRGEGHG